MAAFAAGQTRARLAKVAEQSAKCLAKPDADGVHDLRVAIRRLVQALDLFASLFPDGSAKKVRRRLTRVRRSAAGTRDRDVAIDILQGMNDRRAARSAQRLSRERADELAKLSRQLKRWERKQPWRKWSAQLGLDAQEQSQ